MENGITFAEFVEMLVPVVPGTCELHEDTVLEDLPQAQRLAVWRRLADALEQPADFDIVRTNKTLRDAWSWLNSALESGEQLRASSVLVSLSETTRVRLRPLTDQDLPALYEASFDPEMAPRWRFRGQTVAIDQFVQSLSDGVATQFVVEMQHSKEPIGLVVAYDHNQGGMHCKIAFLRFGRAQGDWGATLEGLFHFITYLFTTFPYRKLFAEVPAYNMELLDGLVGGLLTEEGCLKEYLFYEGRHVDMFQLSMSRAQWSAFHAAWDAPPAA
jgi:RimJ/RimL family protein N-acetyltransferase